MDLLLDVNVILDICQPRSAFAPAAHKAISQCKQAGGRLRLYTGSVQTLQYTLAQGLESNFAERPQRKIGKSSKDTRHPRCQVFDAVAAS